MKQLVVRRSATALVMTLTLLAIGAGWSQDAPLDGIELRVSSPLRAVLTLAPGASGTYQLVVENDGVSTAVVDIEPADFELDDSGDVRQMPPRTHAASNAAWVDVASQVEVPAGASRTVPVGVRVPTDAAAGSYWSLLNVKPHRGTTFEEEANEGAVRTAVTIEFRYAVTVLTHVGEPSEQQLRFRDPQLTEGEHPATAALAVTVENAGRFVAAAEVWLELYDDQGGLVDRLEEERARIYPGGGLRHTFQLGQIGDAPHQAVIIADAGGEDVFGVRYDLQPAAGER